jgi:hypothetical protein
MGALRMGPPHDLILALRDALGCEVFVETGTYHGDTAAWAADEFARVVTVERAATIHQQALEAHGEVANVRFVLGDSRDALREIVPGLERPAVLRLDSHWSGGQTYGEGDECPLLDELAVIAQAPAEHVVLIDDARLFLAAPPRPHDPAQWPSIDEVLDALRDGGKRPAVAVIEDVICSVPAAVEPVLVAYCQDVASRGWESATRTRRPSLVWRASYKARKVLGR